MILSTVVGAVVVGTLLFGPLGFQQYLFDRFVQPPSSSILGFEADGDSTTPLP
jgi:hypothetical protein